MAGPRAPPAASAILNLIRHTCPASGAVPGSNLSSGQEIASSQKTAPRDDPLRIPTAAFARLVLWRIMTLHWNRVIAWFWIGVRLHHLPSWEYAGGMGQMWLAASGKGQIDDRPGDQ